MERSSFGGWTTPGPCFGARAIREAPPRGPGWGFHYWVRWPASSVALNTTDGKLLHATPRICGLACGLGVSWFWPRRHRQLVSYPLRIRRRPAWLFRPTEEAVRVTWPAPALRRLRQRQQQRSTSSFVFSHILVLGMLPQRGQGRWGSYPTWQRRNAAVGSEKESPATKRGQGWEERVPYLILAPTPIGRPALPVDGLLGLVISGRLAVPVRDNAPCGPVGRGGQLR